MHADGKVTSTRIPRRHLAVVIVAIVLISYTWPPWWLWIACVALICFPLWFYLPPYCNRRPSYPLVRSVTLWAVFGLAVWLGSAALLVRSDLTSTRWWTYGHGSICLTYRYDTGGYSHLIWTPTVSVSVQAPSVLSFLGTQWHEEGFNFHYDGYYTSGVVIQRATYFPLVSVAVCTVAPAYLLISLRRHRRHCDGLCRHCGYNLTGNVSGRCPECGTDVNPLADPRH